jgi:hypothetical protein
MANDFSSARAASLFDLTKFLEGRTRAWGIFEDRFGRVRRRFSVEMSGHWEGSAFYLDETFIYDDGASERRLWRIVPEGTGQFTATCADCVGTARGQYDTDSVRMAYRFRLKMDRRALDVDFDDRIYRISDGIAINRATMRKWGLRLGEVSLFFHRVAPEQGARIDAAAA